MSSSHIIAIDLDGTLLTNDQQISKRTKEMLMKASEAGHHVVISTGRPIRSSISYYNQLMLKTPMVNFNGAYVHHPLDESWGVHHAPFDIHVAKAIIEACVDFNVHNVMASVIDEVYLDQHDEEFIQYLTFLGGDFSLITGNIHSILKEPPTSMFIYPRADHATELFDVITNITTDVVEKRNWGPPLNIIEIAKNGMNKAVGLKKIAEKFKIPRERIIAFGDQHNDLEMIQFAGQGIAMGNAVEELKSVAKAVTKSNQEDGIAEYLQDALPL